MGRGVLAKYMKAAAAQNLSYEQAAKMSDADLHSFLSTTKAETVNVSVRKELDEIVPDLVDELSRNRYMTIQRLHEKYKDSHPDGYGYTQFKKVIKDYQKSHNLVFHVPHNPAEEMQIDFAGDKVWLTDEKTGELTPVVLLVCTLPYSGMGYAQALPNARMEHFYGGISDAFTFFGGVTTRAKSDNMQQWVKKYDRYEPSFNQSVIDWSTHYETTLLTCRVKKPRDKGPVEGIVKKLYNAVYSELHGEVHNDLSSMNTRIYELVDAFNSKPSKMTGRSRLEIFEAEEKPLLGALPPTPFIFRYKKKTKLNSSYHVVVDKVHYSVPYQFVGQEINVLWDRHTVEIYSAEGNRIATHYRKYKPGSYVTDDSHMPKNHLAYKRSLEYNAAYFLERAERIGQYTYRAIDIILKSNKHAEQGYSSCQGVLSLGKKYGYERLERAARRMASSSTVTYTMLKNILANNLDNAVEEPPVATVPNNDYVRGAEAFNI